LHLLLLQQQQQGPKSFSQNLSAKMNDEYLSIDGTRKVQPKTNQRNHHKKLKTHRKRATARTTPIKQNTQIEMLTKPQNPPKKKKTKSSQNTLPILRH
jgi:hypothetical protein